MAWHKIETEVLRETREKRKKQVRVTKINQKHTLHHQQQQGVETIKSKISPADMDRDDEAVLAINSFLRLIGILFGRQEGL